MKLKILTGVLISSPKEIRTEPSIALVCYLDRISEAQKKKTKTASVYKLAMN